MLYSVNNTKDDALWVKFLAGEKRAFELIYRKYARILFAYGSKISFDNTIVKDAIQELFIHLWDKKDSLKSVQNVKVYLLKSLRNKLYRTLDKKEKFNNLDCIETKLSNPSIQESIILEELKKEQLLKLHYHLQQLPTRQREVVHLKYFQNLKNPEIAELLDINYQSVANILHRGLNNLKVKLGKKKNPILNKEMLIKGF